MVDYFQLFLLGGIAGFTIFLGIPFALLPAKQKMKSFLNAIAIGILFFLLVDVFEHAWEKVSDEIATAVSNSTNLTNGFILLIIMFAGVAISLLGLALYQNSFMAKNPQVNIVSGMNGDKTNIKKDYLNKRIAIMIAIGIGVHNLSEGLAIGQSYASNELSLALMLIIGFGAHNATEGFGIVSPLAGAEEKPKLSFLFGLGLIGGGPTFLGTIIGSMWVSDIAFVLFLSLAAGALIFVILLMNSSTSKNAKLPLVMTGILIGLMAGFLTDLLIAITGA